MKQIKKPYVVAQGTSSSNDLMIPQSDNNPRRYSREEYRILSEKQAEKLRSMSLTPEEMVLQEFNKRYAIVHTSTTHILFQKGTTHFELDSRRSFLCLHENDFFVNSEGKQVNKAYFWLKHPNRRTFKNIVFDPARPGDYDGNFNIFKGFAVEPMQGDCSLYWGHVDNVICCGNIEYCRYVRKWMACVIQKPNLLATALVLRGLQGTGKNKFVEYFGKIFDPYYVTVTTLDHVTGKFNNHLKYAYLIHANEATWGNTKKEVGAIKALITDPTIMIEGKGKDAVPVNNCRHLIVSSNEDWAVPMDLDDRRFFVLNISAHRKEDTRYFQELEHQMSQGGIEALLYDLLQEDLSDFDPRKMPPNDFGFDMKMRTASSVVKFIYDALGEGRFSMATCSKTKAWGSHPSKQVYHCYRDWCKQEGLRQETREEFGKWLKKILAVEKRRPTIKGAREWWYEFSSIEESRRAFEKFTKQSARIWEE